ncbi:MAG: hypothetical protein VX000_14140, partial [Myxococcota bacterium]|nr:hypothetical protein [Myxococcota bacterium]
MDLLFYLVIWIGRAILKAYRSGRGAPRDSVDDPGNRREPEPGTAGPRRSSPVRSSLGTLDRMLQELDVAAHGAPVHAKALAVLSERFAALGPGGRPFLDLIEGRLRPEIRAAEDLIRRVTQQVRSAPPAQAVGVLHAAEHLPAARRILGAAPGRIAGLQRLAGSREDPSTRAVLADADAMAAALWAPFHAFAIRHELAVPDAQPVTALATDGASVGADLLSARTPVLRVPRDVAADPYRQTAVAHEIARLAWMRVPGLAKQTLDAMDIDATPALLRLHDGRIRGSLRQPFRAWAEEMFCDAMTVMLLGPSGLRGLLHRVASPADLDAIQLAHASRGRSYAPEPPAHLRIGMAASLLARMGFEAEAQSIQADWDRLHRSVDSVVLPCQDERLIRVPASVLLDFIGPRLETWFNAELPALAGFRLESIPGWMMSPGVWARVRRRAAE